MHVFVNVYMDIRICVYVYVRTYVCMRGMCVCVYVCTRVCVYACMRVCVYACMRVCVYACIRVCVYVCMCVCVYVCMYMYVYMYIVHTYTYTSYISCISYILHILHIRHTVHVLHSLRIILHILLILHISHKIKNYTLHIYIYVYIQISNTSACCLNLSRSSLVIEFMLFESGEKSHRLLVQETIGISSNVTLLNLLEMYIFDYPWTLLTSLWDSFPFPSFADDSLIFIRFPGICFDSLFIPEFPFHRYVWYVHWLTNL